MLHFNGERFVNLPETYTQYTALANQFISLRKFKLVHLGDFDVDWILGRALSGTFSLNPSHEKLMASFVTTKFTSPTASADQK